MEIKIDNTEILNPQIIYFHFKDTISFDNLNLYFQTIFFKHINRKLIIQRTSCLISKQTNYFFQNYFLNATASEKIVKLMETVDVIYPEDTDETEEDNSQDKDL